VKIILNCGGQGGGASNLLKASSLVSEAQVLHILKTLREAATAKCCADENPQPSGGLISIEESMKNICFFLNKQKMVI
jgi:hypothetical protein